MTTSGRSCCIPFCSTTYADNTTLHSFPHPERDKKRFLMWMNAVGSSLTSLDHNFIYKNRKICHKHFEVRYLTWTKRLCHGAVPTLHMSDNAADNAQSEKNELHSEPDSLDDETSQSVASRKRRTSDTEIYEEVLELCSNDSSSKYNTDISSDEYTESEDLFQISQSVSQKKKCVNNVRTYRKSKLKHDTNSKDEDSMSDNQKNTTPCVECVQEKDIDERDDRFCLLLIEKLQFLKPCMRSNAYTEILKTVDCLKYKHRSECEIERRKKKRK